jgi:hypothetical protein
VGRQLPCVVVGECLMVICGDLVVGWASWRVDGVKEDFMG